MGDILPFIFVPEFLLLGGNTLIQEKLCPICAKNNDCKINKSNEACWCTTYAFPDRLNNKLESLPTYCICETCAQKLGAKRK